MKLRLSQGRYAVHVMLQLAYLSEKSGKLRCLNIMLVLRSVATGFAMPLPAMSLPTCRAPCSKIATLSPMLHPAAQHKNSENVKTHLPAQPPPAARALLQTMHMPDMSGSPPEHCRSIALFGTAATAGIASICMCTWHYASTATETSHNI